MENQKCDWHGINCTDRISYKLRMSNKLIGQDGYSSEWTCYYCTSCFKMFLNNQRERIYNFNNVNLTWKAEKINLT